MKSAAHVLRQRGEVEVVGLVTTLNEARGRVAMHGVRAELVQAQADATGWPVPLPWPCSNDEYEARMLGVIGKADAEGIAPLFPIWGMPGVSPALARTMIAAGLRAALACVDPRHLPPAFAGRAFGSGLLADLPPGVDPCGENGEYHTFCHAAPVFDRPIPVDVGDVVERDGFWFADLIPGQQGSR